MEKIGKYRVLKKAGEGASSTVFLVMDERIQKKWAVKAVRKRYCGRKDGVFVLKDLDYPDIPRIVEEAEDQDCLFEVMDFFDGVTLEEYLKRSGTISLEEALDFGLSIVRTMSYLHSVEPPVIYRDLKPKNIIVTPEKRLKLIDFDIAVRGEKDNCEALGTPEYASPEQYRGICSLRTDIYNLGMTLKKVLEFVPDSGEFKLSASRLIKRSYLALADKASSEQPEKRFGSTGEICIKLEKLQKAEKYMKPLRAVAAVFFSAAVLLLLCSRICTEAEKDYSIEYIRVKSEQAAEIMEQAVPYKEGFITELMKAEEELQEAESYIQDMEEKGYGTALENEILRQQATCCTLIAQVQEDEAASARFYIKGAELELELMKNIEKDKEYDKNAEAALLREAAGLFRLAGSQAQAEKLYLQLTDDKAADDEQRMEAWISLCSMRFFEEADEKGAREAAKKAKLFPESEKSQLLRSMENLLNRQEGE